MPEPNASVNAVAAAADNVVLGGAFGAVGGEPRFNVAAIEPDGTLAAWKPDATGSVHALELVGSTVYLGGRFANVAKQGGGFITRNRAAAVDTTAGQATAWDPDVTGDDVRTLAVVGTTVYLGGEFTKIGTTSRNNAGAVDVQGGVDLGWSPEPIAGIDGVHAIEPAGSTIFIGGDFQTITNAAGTGTAPRKFVAAVNAATGFDTGWDATVNGRVLGLALSGSTLYMVGGFGLSERPVKSSEAQGRGGEHHDGDRDRLGPAPGLAVAQHRRRGGLDRLPGRGVRRSSAARGT